MFPSFYYLVGRQLVTRDWWGVGENRSSQVVYYPPSLGFQAKEPQGSGRRSYPRVLEVGTYVGFQIQGPSQGSKSRHLSSQGFRSGKVSQGCRYLHRVSRNRQVGEQVGRQVGTFLGFQGFCSGGGLRLVVIRVCICAVCTREVLLRTLVVCRLKRKKEKSCGQINNISSVAASGSISAVASVLSQSQKLNKCMKKQSCFGHTSFPLKGFVFCPGGAQFFYLLGRWVGG